MLFFHVRQKGPSPGKSKESLVRTIQAKFHAPPRNRMNLIPDMRFDTDPRNEKQKRKKTIDVHALAGFVMIQHFAIVEPFSFQKLDNTIIYRRRL